MSDKVKIDVKTLYNDLIELCKTPGPTQACVKVSETDPRIDGEFPIEKTIRDIIKRLNKELKGKGKHRLLIIRHMGNLIIVGGLEELKNINYDEAEIIDLYKFNQNTEFKEYKEKIRNIPVVFGAHLDEITYIVSKKREDLRDILKGEVYEVIPLCRPPERIPEKEVFYETNSHKEGKIIKGVLAEIPQPECKIVGFRSRTFERNLGYGLLYKEYEPKTGFKLTLVRNDTVLVEDKKRKTIEDIEVNLLLGDEFDEYFKFKERLVLKLKDNKGIREGDFVIQDYGDWKKGKKENYPIFKSKALDDRVGCIAAIYAVKELASLNIPSKAILTSSEEGVPRDVSWGRFVKATYNELCKDETITLVCDGMDGARLRMIFYFDSNGNKVLREFEETEEHEELKEAVVIPYTSNGKGGGDVGVFSIFRDEVISSLNKEYEDNIAVMSTDYSSRSYEVKIMDRWTLIGFIQWTCGRPADKQSLCHNTETVHILQVVNIIRTMIHFTIFIYRIYEKMSS